MMISQVVNWMRAMGIHLDSEDLRTFPAATAAGLGEVFPVVLPIAGDPGEKACEGGNAFRALEADAAAVHQADFAMAGRAGDVSAAIEEVEELAGEGKGGLVLRLHGAGVSRSWKTSAPEYIPWMARISMGRMDQM